MDEEKDAIRFTNRIVEVVKRIPVPVIFSIVSIALLILYWFIAIFLFHRDFYNNNSIWITLLFSFAFSFTWFILSIGLSIISVAYIDKKKNKETDINGVLFVSGFISIIYLCAAILFIYIIKKRNPTVGFDCFLLISYSYMFFRILWVSVVFVIHRWKKQYRTKAQLVESQIEETDK